MKKLFLLFVYSIFLSGMSYASKTVWVPIQVGDITTFVPHKDENYTPPTLTLGDDPSLTKGEELILSPTVSSSQDIESYEWRLGNTVVGTGRTYDASGLSVGTHALVLTITDSSGARAVDEVVVTVTSCHASTDYTQDHEIVGTTKGEFSVNQGTANYSLKIDVPPGVADMEPKLSLNYSSSAGNGYMGMGWSIGGVSAITRCPQTKAVDGADHKFGVKYDENDRFCLDGQRLIAVNGAYGADGTEYRTEIDTYAKVKSVGNHGGGPASFEVKTKSGLTYHYGLGSDATTHSPFLEVDNRKMFWKVSEIKDTYANTIAFHYETDHYIGESYLKKITYANNEVVYSHS